jgi:membrane-associated phospholipid phosphatase
MHKIDYAIHLVMTVFLIFGVYQFYFWCQRHPMVACRRFTTGLDDRIPYWPSWSWIYSFLYYPAIVYLNWTVTSPQHFNHMAMSFFILLTGQMAFFVFFPVETPAHWREINKGRTLSEKFLLFVRSFDAPSNCVPSMHVSVAVLTALHAQGSIGAWGFLFPVLIAISCVFTKQHYLLDLPAGAALGWGAFAVFQFMYHQGV